LKKKRRQDNMTKLLNPVVTVAVVGHIQFEDLQQLKQTLENISGFKIVFFKTSSSKLWIQEGEER